jgi:hypothetical protein
MLGRSEMVDLPPLHVWLDIEQILEPDAPGFTRSCFKHKPAKLGVENWCGIVMTPAAVNVTPLDHCLVFSLSVSGLHIGHSTTLLQ